MLQSKDFSYGDQEALNRERKYRDFLSWELGYHLRACMETYGRKEFNPEATINALKEWTQEQAGRGQAGE